MLANQANPSGPRWLGSKYAASLRLKNGSPDCSTASAITRSSLTYEILEHGSKTVDESIPCFLNKGAGSTPLSSNCRQKLEIEDAKIDKPALLLRSNSQSCHKFDLMTLARILLCPSFQLLGFSGKYDIQPTAPGRSE